MRTAFLGTPCSSSSGDDSAAATTGVPLEVFSCNRGPGIELAAPQRRQLAMPADEEPSRTMMLMCDGGRGRRWPCARWALTAGALSRTPNFSQDRRELPAALLGAASVQASGRGDCPTHRGAVTAPS